MDINMSLSQKQILTPQMIQTMKILQMNTMELEQYIETVALENPVIDSVRSEEEAFEDQRKMDIQKKINWLESTDLQNRVYYKEEKEDCNREGNWRDIREDGEGLSEYLLSQLILHEYTTKERIIIEYIVDALDPSGYFTDDMEEIARAFSVSLEEVETLLSDIQNLDPAGVGARTLKECLLMQLYRKQNYSKITEGIIADHLESMAKNHLKDIADKMNISVDEIKESREEIRSLNPKPGNCFNDRNHFQYISPDVAVIKLKGHFNILVNEYQYPRIQINAYYQNLEKTTDDIEVKEYLKEKMNQIGSITNSIEYRQSTLSKVAHILVEKQMDFFLHGPGHRRPLRLVDIAEEIDLHESTVSRALQNKYLQCSWGIYPLNYFLTAVAVQSVDTGEDQTREQMMDRIRKIIGEEDKKKPLSDQKICEKMLEQNIKISRRTINKYRQLMGIPDKGGRKDQ